MGHRKTKRHVIILLILYLSCHADNKEKADSILIVAPGPQIEDFEKHFGSFFNSNSFKLSQESEGRAGDCDGSMRKYISKAHDTTVVLDNFNCGDYGFERTRYLLSEDEIFAIKTIESKLSGPGRYTLTEKYYYFEPDSVLVKSRTQKELSWKDTSVVGSISFKLQRFAADSIRTNFLSKLLSATAYDSL